MITFRFRQMQKYNYYPTHHFICKQRNIFTFVLSKIRKILYDSKFKTCN